MTVVTGHRRQPSQESMRTDVIAGPRLGRLLYGPTDNVLVTAVTPRL